MLMPGFPDLSSPLLPCCLSFPSVLSSLLPSFPLLSLPLPSPSSPCYAVAGSDTDNFFRGFGSDHLSVSRTVTCTPYNVGEKDAFDIPFPCVLRE